DVAVQDAGRVGVGEAVADLAARLERGGVVQLSRPECLPERATRHEFVGDIDVPRVAPERVGTQAAPVAQPCRACLLAPCARGSLPLPGDDLECDVESRVLVSRQPYRPRA